MADAERETNISPRASSGALRPSQGARRFLIQLLGHVHVALIKGWFDDGMGERKHAQVFEKDGLAGPGMGTRRHFLRRAGLAALTIVALPDLAAASSRTALRRGSKGPAVGELNERLFELSYLRGEQISSEFTLATFHAVVAFQKCAGLARDGIVGPRTRAALQTARRPRPLLASGGKRIEVSLSRQVAFLVQRGVVTRTVAVSSGRRGYRTPRGSFSIYRRSEMEWSEAYEVWLPWAAFFVRGIAFHSYREVPPYPASHGCVRVPPPFAREVYRFARIGTRVVVR